MSDDHRTDFEPRQLDALEDALAVLDEAELELEEVAETYGLDDATRRRFAAYRDVSAAVRDALPEHEAPADALERAMAAVHAEATGVGVAAPLEPGDRPEPTAAEVAGGWGRWWKRWRAATIPLATLAGTAALVLWVVRPDGSGTLGEANTLAEGPARPTMPTPGGEPATDELRDAEEAASEPEPAPGATESLEAERSAPSAVEQAAPAPAKAKKTAPALKEENVAGPRGYTEQPAIDTEDPKGQLYERLSAAHRMRRNGNCASAVIKYEALLGQPDLDAIQRARAEAGLGLCRDLLGDGKRSSAHFKAAREADPTIEGWIDSERTKTAPPGEKSRRKALPKKRSKADQSAIDSL